MDSSLPTDLLQHMLITQLFKEDVHASGLGERCLQGNKIPGHFQEQQGSS